LGGVLSEESAHLHYLYLHCRVASLAAICLPGRQPDNAPPPPPTVSSSTVIPIPTVIPKQPAVRVYTPAFPARVALISDGQLMLLNGGQAGAPPAPVTRDDRFSVTAPSFSHDGRWLAWLAYLRYPAGKQYTGEDYLWVACSDGSGGLPG
jgi:hypothetical protein